MSSRPKYRMTARATFPVVANFESAPGKNVNLGLRCGLMLYPVHTGLCWAVFGPYSLNERLQTSNFLYGIIFGFTLHIRNTLPDLKGKVGM